MQDKELFEKLKKVEKLKKQLKRLKYRLPSESPIIEVLDESIENAEIAEKKALRKLAKGRPTLKGILHKLPIISGMLKNKEEKQRVEKEKAEGELSDFLENDGDAIHNIRESKEYRDEKKKGETTNPRLINDFYETVVPTTEAVDAIIKNDEKSGNSTIDEIIKKPDETIITKERIGSGRRGYVDGVSVEKKGSAMEFAVKSTKKLSDAPILNPLMNKILKIVSAIEYGKILKAKKILKKNSPRIYRYDKNNHIIMEKIEGKTLEVILKEKTIKANLIAELGKIISVMHNSNFIHRDLNSKNIMLTNKGLWKIIDFSDSEHTPGKKGITKKLFYGEIKDIRMCEELKLYVDENIINSFIQSYLLNRDFRKMASFVIEHRDTETVCAFLNLILYTTSQITKPSRESIKYIYGLTIQISELLYKYRKDDKKSIAMFEKLIKEIKEQMPGVDLTTVEKNKRTVIGKQPKPVPIVVENKDMSTANKNELEKTIKELKRKIENLLN
ncbi:MAG: protein kinase [Candidatus Aenigmarchaeota archaeon]|nr:protein kinase [Candidatus Aenigmarchaeota archaeon]